MSVFKTEARVVNPDNSIRWSYFISRPKIIKGIVNWDGIEIDITERKMMEFELLKAKKKAEESDQLKTEFIRNMSHEIRTPLNGILGFSNILNNPDLIYEKRKQYINIIQNSGNQLLKIIDDILEISRLGTQQEKINKSKINLNKIFTDLYSIFKLKTKEKNISLHLKKALSDNESLIITDETRLRKIINNLLTNAVKYTNKGFIEFGYTIAREHAPLLLQIYVKDTGIGIRPENHESIFKLFSQEEKSLSLNVGGLGLGLSIAKKNAELLGGKITLKSEKRKGSTFFVTIPYQPVNQTITSSYRNNKITKKQNKYTILIVEDEEANYLYIDTLLKDFELDIITLHAKHGKKAVEICKENSEIDLILMDLKMPIMTGFEATKLIKEFSPDLPIIALTSYSTKEEEKQAFSAGCDDFISKPINKKFLNEKINKYLTVKK